MIEHIVSFVEDGFRADKIVLGICGEGVSYTFLQKIFRKKKVRVNSKRAYPNDRLTTGDIIKIFIDNNALKAPTSSYPPSSQRSDYAARFRSMIIFEGNDFIAINKPTNLAVQMGSKVKISVETLMKSYDPQLKLVHRIDRDTSGVLLIAKGRAAAQKLTRMFRENAIHKTYLAVVDGKIKSAGIIDNFLKKAVIGGEEKMVIASEKNFENERSNENSKRLRAITKYSPQKILDPDLRYYTLLELSPQTGRKHQLRVHCAEVLHAPILGDVKYGPKNRNVQWKQLFLHAYKVQIEGEEVVAPIPEYFPN